MKFLLLLLFACSVQANTIDEKCPMNVLWGAPVSQEGSNQYLCRTNYAVDYSYKTKTPVYVVEHITPEHIIITVQRKNNFRKDTEIDQQHRSTLKDYANAIYDRGHLAAAANFTYDESVMSESFLLSNMMPQDQKNNRVIWNHLEQNIRKLVGKSKGLYVITGTIYSKEYKSIGNGVGVPDEIYKIVIDSSRERMIAFRFPNKAIDSNLVSNYIVSVKSIEDSIGVDFSPDIPKNLKHLESEVVKYKDWF